MKRRLAVFSVAAAQIVSGSNAFAGTCLTEDIMSPAGQRVSSPYGVDRSGSKSASRGYHQGLDIVNSAGAGTPIYSGSSGTGNNHWFGGGGNVADITSGDTRFMYLHMNTTVPERELNTFRAGQQIGTMGCKGMDNCSVHLHLYTLLKGNVLAASGANGRTWKQGTGKSAPLTADQIKAALPTAWYYVNPEPFLPRQIPISKTYPDMPGGVRTTTLPKTCTPGSNEAAAPGNLVSESATQSRQTSIASRAGGPTGSEDFSAKLAEQDTRSVLIEIAKLSATELAANTFDYQAQQDAALAQMLALYANDIGRKATRR